MLSDHEEAVEFIVETDGPLSLLEDVTAVLYVGETMITEVRGRGETEYSFLALDEDRLEPGAPITLAYPGTPREVRAEAAYRYEPPTAKS